MTESIPDVNQNNNELDLSGSAHDSINQTVEFLRALQKHPFRRYLPSDSIAIGPRTKNGKGMSLSERILRITTESPGSIHSVDNGSNRAIFETIQRQSSAIQEEVGVVLMSFFLHNFPEESRHQLLSAISATYPHAVVIANDYTLLSVPEENVRPYLVTEFEREVAERKGIEQFINEHRCFTLQSLQALFAEHFTFVSSTPLKAARGLVIGHSENVWDEKQFSASSFLKDTQQHHLIPAA